jgi:ankyrin repeat protein
MTPHMEQWLEAAGDGDLQLLKDLLHGNPYTDINAGDRCGSSALHYAAEKGRLEVAKFLVDQGAIVNVTNMWDKTPLHEAANAGHDELVWFLVENGARIEATSNKKRFTPLHLASQFGHTSVVEYLVQNGADVSAQAEVRSAITTPETFFITLLLMEITERTIFFEVLGIHLHIFVYLFIHLS